MKVKTAIALFCTTAAILTACGTAAPADQMSGSQSVKAAASTQAMESTAASSSAASQSSAASEKGYTKISAEEAKKMMDEGGVTIVDVRRADEFAAGHIPDAINVPNESIGTQQPAELPDTGAKILVYCHSGRRSAIASAKLAKAGYTNIYDFGGIIDWPYDVVQ